MAFHRGLCNAQVGCNLFVALALDDQAEYFALTCAEFRVGDAGEEGARYGRGKKPPSGMDAAQRTYQGIMRHSLDDVAARTRLQRLMDVLIAFVRGEYDELGIAMTGYHSANGLNTAHSREPEIHERDVGKVFFEEFHGFFAASRLGNGRHVRRGLNDGGNSDAHDGMIVNDENPNPGCFFRSCLLFHRVPPPCPQHPPFRAQAKLRGRGFVEDGDHREYVAFQRSEEHTSE